MERRAALATIGLGSLTVFGGCSGIAGSNAESDRVLVTARNTDQEPVTVDVFFTDEKRQTLFSTRYNLDGGTTNEDHEFTGDPYYVYVVVNESRTIVTRFRGSNCRRSQDVTTWIVYDGTDDPSIDFICTGG